MTFRLRRLTCMAVFLLISMFFPSGTHAAWPTTASTLCWALGDAPGVFMKARVTPSGGGFYRGSVIIVSNKQIVEIQDWTAYVLGDSVHIMASGAGKKPERMYTTQARSVMNRKTMEGTYEFISSHQEYSADILMTTYSSGTSSATTPVPCSSIWK